MEWQVADLRKMNNINIHSLLVGRTITYWSALVFTLSKKELNNILFVITFLLQNTTYVIQMQNEVTKLLILGRPFTQKHWKGSF
jgi:hypothetical protein